MTDTDRLDVVEALEALEAAGWTGDDEYPLSILRKNGATYGVVGSSGDSSLSGPSGWTANFPSDMPTVVIVAACLAAAAA